MVHVVFLKIAAMFLVVVVAMTLAAQAFSSRTMVI
jgi:hypothetical protein